MNSLKPWYKISAPIDTVFCLNLWYFEKNFSTMYTIDLNLFILNVPRAIFIKTSFFYLNCVFKSFACGYIMYDYLCGQGSVKNQKFNVFFNLLNVKNWKRLYYIIPSPVLLVKKYKGEISLALLVTTIIYENCSYIYI